MTQLLLTAGRMSEVTSPERRADLEVLADLLKSDDVDVELKITEYVPGRHGVIWGETFAIYIGGIASGVLINKVVDDICDNAKAWAVRRFRKKMDESPTGNPRSEIFTIYGPDGEVLRKFRINKEGEEET